MDSLVEDIMKNFDREMALYVAKNPVNLFSKYLQTKGVTGHKLMHTEDDSDVVGTKSGGFIGGHGIVKYHINNTVYVGEMNRNLREGFGYRNYSQSDLIYAGEYKNNYKCGKGKLWSPSKNRWVFDGRWDRDLKNGYGEMWRETATYKGNWVDDRMEGIGKMEWVDGQRYEGEYLNDLRHGKGTMTFVNGDNYTGQWRNGKAHGSGFYQWRSGEIYEGQWHDGVMDGDGRINYNIPVIGVGSMRMGQVTDLDFGVQDKDQWQSNVSRSMQSIKVMQSNIVPDSARRGNNEYNQLIGTEQTRNNAFENMGGINVVSMEPIPYKSQNQFTVQRDEFAVNTHNNGNQFVSTFGETKNRQVMAENMNSIGQRGRDEVIVRNERLDENVNRMNQQVVYSTENKYGQFTGTGNNAQKVLISDISDGKNVVVNQTSESHTTVPRIFQRSVNFVSGNNENQSGYYNR